jgi:hypothetical protein
MRPQLSHRSKNYALRSGTVDASDGGSNAVGLGVFSSNEIRSIRAKPRERIAGLSVDALRVLVTTVNSIRLAHNPNRAMVPSMGGIFKLIWWAVIGLFRSRASREAEIVTLRRLPRAT